MGIVWKAFLVILVAWLLVDTEVFSSGGAVRSRSRGKGPPPSGLARAYSRVPLFSRYGRGGRLLSSASGGLPETEASGGAVAADLERDGWLRWAAAVDEVLSKLQESGQASGAPEGDTPSLHRGFGIISHGNWLIPVQLLPGNTTGSSLSNATGLFAPVTRSEPSPITDQPGLADPFLTMVGGVRQEFEIVSTRLTTTLDICSTAGRQMRAKRSTTSKVENLLEEEMEKLKKKGLQELSEQTYIAVC
ncbi:hypothetical protein Bbelb_105430 [Branchiostoma belcheri]|nr:hypothetical protein Bbelb_105430 [Branchiostoma belcheri]